jgi:uncharacterized membrane protein YfhO
MAYDQILFMDYMETKRWKILFAVAVLLGAIGYCYKQEVLSSDIPYMISAALVVFYGILLCIRKKYVKQFLLCTCLIIEIMGNAINGFSSSGQIDADYYFGDTADIAEITDAEEPKIGERMELAEGKMLDESIWYTMSGVTMFGSTALGDTVDAMDQLGFYTGVNEYLYEGGTPVTDLLLGVKSVIYRNDEQMVRSGYEYSYSKNGMHLYQNSLNTSIGYWMSKEAKYWNYRSYNPFDVQNDLMEKAYDSPILYENVDIDMPVGDGCEVTDYGDGSYYVEKDDSAQNKVTFVFQAEQDMNFFLHFDTSIAESSEIFVNGISQQSGRLNSKILSVGEIEAGDVVTLEIQLKSEDEGNGMITIRGAYLDSENYRQLVYKMQKNRFKVSSYSSTDITGTIEAQEDGVVFFSIPYDEGWTAYVDDKEVDTIAMEDGFISVPVALGNHEITLKYCPKGFSLGWKISAAGWLLFLFSLLFAECKKRFRKNSDIVKSDIV